MASPKKNPKQVKATVKAASIRIGKKRRAEIIEQYRPIFQEVFSEHLNRSNRSPTNRLDIRINTKAIPNDLRKDPRKYESCPVCRHIPETEYIEAHPRLTLIPHEAHEFLQKLGFDHGFVSNYLQRLRSNKNIEKRIRKSAFGIPDFRIFIHIEGRRLLRRFPGITITAATEILEELFTENEYTPGEGTIKKHLVRVFDESPELSIHWDGDPIKWPYEPPRGWSDDISADLAQRISYIRLAADEAIKEVEKEAKEIIKDRDSIKLYQERIRERFQRAKLERSHRVNGEEGPLK